MKTDKNWKDQFMARACDAESRVYRRLAEAISTRAYEADGALDVASLFHDRATELRQEAERLVPEWVTVKRHG